jgi:hypothetical protein
MYPENFIDFFNQYLSKYPPVLEISDIATIFQKKLPTIRARIRRGVFPVPVRHDPGGRQYVLLVDLIGFLLTGEDKDRDTDQDQPVMKTANTQIKLEKKRRGRPTKRDLLIRASQDQGDRS